MDVIQYTGDPGELARVIGEKLRVDVALRDISIHSRMGKRKYHGRGSIRTLVTR